MSYSTKNYTEHGGETTNIGGTLNVTGTLNATGTVNLGSATVAGLPVAENQADSTASTIADLKTDFNTLLAALKTAGLMEADE